MRFLNHYLNNMWIKLKPYFWYNIQYTFIRLLATSCAFSSDCITTVHYSVSCLHQVFHCLCRKLQVHFCASPKCFSGDCVTLVLLSSSTLATKFNLSFVVGVQNCGKILLIEMLIWDVYWSRIITQSSSCKMNQSQCGSYLKTVANFSDPTFKPETVKHSDCFGNLLETRSCLVFAREMLCVPTAVSSDSMTLKHYWNKKINK